MKAQDIRPDSIIAEHDGKRWIVLAIEGDEETLLQETDEKGDVADDGMQQWVTFDGLTDEGWTVVDY